VLVLFDNDYFCPATVEVTSIIHNVRGYGEKEKPNSNDTWYGGY